MTDRRHAEIAGAGIAGLTAASALARNGWTVRVHERNAELREIGAGIAVWDNGVRALREVGAFDEATHGSDVIRNWELLDERHRTLQRTWMLPGVSESFAVLRTQLHQALAAAARRNGVEIVTDSPVSGATVDGELLLEDGTRLRADLVVGADGVGSRVRAALGTPKRVRRLPDGGGRHLLPRKPGDPANVIIEQWDGGRRIGIVPCTEEWIYVYLCCPAADERGRDQLTDRSTWAESFPRYRDLIERIPDGNAWAAFGDVELDAWSKGRVVVIGDAAHAMPPNLGQAANVAMVNAVALGKTLGRTEDVEAGLAAWEANERAITDATQRFSRFYGWVGIRWPRPLLDVRSALLWGIARSSRAQARINVAVRHEPRAARTRPLAAPGGVR